MENALATRLGCMDTSTTLAHKAQQRLLDVCYGLGYNTAAALSTIWAVNPSCRVELIGKELDPSLPHSAIAHHLLNLGNCDLTPIFTQLAGVRRSSDRAAKSQAAHRRRLDYDLADTPVRLPGRCDFSSCPFSPPSCPQLWTVEFLGLWLAASNPVANLLLIYPPFHYKNKSICTPKLPFLTAIPVCATMHQRFCTAVQLSNKPLLLSLHPIGKNAGYLHLSHSW